VSTDWLRRLAWRLRPALRPICWWRGKHHGFWAHHVWVCRICAKQTIGPRPVGTLITDEPAKHIYQVGAHGELRRVDKVRGGKKARRRKAEEVRRVQRLREQLLGEPWLQNERGERG
jgi:hypothetical protein